MGGEYTAEELRDRALESAVLGGTIGGGTRAGIETAGAAGRGVRAAIPGGYTPTDPEAAADLANRLQAIADRDGIDLKNINLMDPQGARAAVDQAHKEITGDLKAASQRNQTTLKSATLTATKSVRTRSPFSEASRTHGPRPRTQSALPNWKHSSVCSATHKKASRSQGCGVSPTN